MRVRGRAGVGVLAAAAAVVTVASAVVAGAGPASAAVGVSVSGWTRYAVSDDGSPVRAVVVVSLTEGLSSGGGADPRGYSLWLPDSATDLQVVSEGRRLTVTRATRSGQEYADIAFPSSLAPGRTRTLEATYLIPGSPPRSPRPGRVGRGYAAFEVYSPGDAGRATIEVDAPSSMTLDLGLPYSERDVGGRTVVTARGGGPYGLWSLAALRDLSQVARTTVAVGDSSFTVLGFPGDTQWSRHIASHLPATVRALERIAGRPWPGDLTTITEDFSGEVYGWAGSYDHGRIAVSEDLDAALLAHELSHAWANRETLGERWLSEGLAQEMATRATAATGAKDEVHPAVSPGRLGSFPLSDWPEGMGVATMAEVYGYPASWRAMHALFQGSTAASRPALVRALTTKQTVYDAPGETTAPAHPTTWRQAYDLFDVVGHNPQTRALMTTWVITPEDAAGLAARTKARDAYAAQDRLDGAWSLPRGVRAAMADWDFAGAQRAMAQTRDLAGPATLAQRVAAQTGLDVSSLRTAYQSADEDREYREVGARLSTFVQLADAYAAQRQALDRANPLARLGNALVSPAHSLDEAAAAVEDEDPTADQALEAARARASLATWVGLGVIVGGLIVLLGLVLVGRALVRPRPAPDAAAPGVPLPF